MTHCNVLIYIYMYRPIQKIYILCFIYHMSQINNKISYLFALNFLVGAEMGEYHCK